MKNPLATIGVIIKVSPYEDIQYDYGNGDFGTINDLSPFFFRVAGKLIEDDFLYGLYGPVTGGPERYIDLICSAMLRIEPCDWHTDSDSRANFKISPTKVARNDEFDINEYPSLAYWFLHPGGTVVDGFPQFGRAGEIEVFESS